MDVNHVSRTTILSPTGNAKLRKADEAFESTEEPTGSGSTRPINAFGGSAQAAQGKKDRGIKKY